MDAPEELRLTDYFYGAGLCDQVFDGRPAALEQIAEPRHTTDPVAAGNGLRPGACREGLA